MSVLTVVVELHPKEERPIFDWKSVVSALSRVGITPSFTVTRMNVLVGTFDDLMALETAAGTDEHRPTALRRRSA